VFPAAESAGYPISTKQIRLRQNGEFGNRQILLRRPVL
jgi:hypothetical protein